jgi:hypothetical protein
MARRKQPKKGWLWKVLFFLLAPFVVWFIAFWLWFYWDDLSRMFGRNEPGRTTPTPERQMEKDDRRERPASEPPREKIFEEDRQKLEDILKRRN